MWQVLEPNIETVRRRLAASFGCDPEEMAITRNASEALQIAQLGIALKAGDEVVTTNQDYGRMLDTWEQRVSRDGIKLTKVSFPVPPKSMDVLADRLLSGDHAGDEGAALLPHHQSHRADLPGETHCRRSPATRHQDRRRRRSRVCAFPVHREGPRLRLLRHQSAQVAAGADRDRLPVCEAGEHQGPLAADAGCGQPRRQHPQVRGDRHASGGEPQCDRRSADVPRGDRHRAEGGAPPLPAGSLGDPPGEESPRVRIHTNLDPQHSCAIGNVQLTGVPTGKVVSRLWERWRIIATPIVHDEYEGLRVTPNVYTTLEEIDTFAGAMEEISAKGITD